MEMNMQVETKTRFETEGKAQLPNCLFTLIANNIILLGEVKNCKIKPTLLDLTQLPQEYNAMKFSLRGVLAV